VTDRRVLDDLQIQHYDALFGEALNTNRATIRLPLVDDVRASFLTDQPWLAADPMPVPWQEPADLDVVRTGACGHDDDRRPGPAPQVVIPQIGDQPTLAASSRRKPGGHGAGEVRAAPHYGE
jgi:vancomycin aglycone glucosyltransferase